MKSTEVVLIDKDGRVFLFYRCCRTKQRITGKSGNLVLSPPRFLVYASDVNTEWFVPWRFLYASPVKRAFKGVGCEMRTRKRTGSALQTHSLITHSDGFDDRLFLLYNSEVPPWNSRLPVTPLRKIKSETLSVLARFPEKVVN